VNIAAGVVGVDALQGGGVGAKLRGNIVGVGLHEGDEFIASAVLRLE
jgi:hypothetical protein